MLLSRSRFLLIFSTFNFAFDTGEGILINASNFPFISKHLGESLTKYIFACLTTSSFFLSSLLFFSNRSTKQIRENKKLFIPMKNPHEKYWSSESLPLLVLQILQISTIRKIALSTHFEWKYSSSFILSHLTTSLSQTPLYLCEV